MKPDLTSSIRNTVAIESPHGLRSFTLHLGDVTRSKDGGLVVPSHANPGFPPDGAVLSAIARKHDIDFENLEALIAPRPSFGTFRVVDPKSAPYAEVLVVRIPGVQTALLRGGEPLAIIHEALWTLFGSLAALELRSDKLKVLSLPLVAGTRGYEIPDLMGAIIERSIAWLKVSKFMKVINFYVLEEGAIGTWSHAMDGVLGRRFIDTAQVQLAGALREEILAHLGSGHHNWPPPWQSSLEEIERDLQQSRISLERLAGSCRRLVEHMVTTIAAEDKVALAGNRLADSIRELRKQRLVAPWILSHLDCLRELGNAAVHSGDQVTFNPPRLMQDDLLALLASLQRLLAFAAARYS
jgi:hypothetical protein